MSLTKNSFMNTGNTSFSNQQETGAAKKGSKRVIIIIVAVLILLAIIWAVKESQQNRSDVPPSGTVGEVLEEDDLLFKGVLV
jgi:flagellar basal body-associated protein FliL